MRRALFALSLAATAAACSSESAAYRADLDRAEALQRAGRFDAAIAALRAAAAESGEARPRNHAKYLEAKYTLLAGDRAKASAMFEAIGEATPRSEHSADAWLMFAELQDADDAAGRGRQAREKLLSSFPGSGAARVAWKQLVQLEEDTGGVDAALRFARQWEAPLDKGELSELVHFSIAELLERAGQRKEARAEYDSVATRWPYPHGTFFDDALFRASKLDESFEHYTLAVSDLERLLAHREQSLFMGSYERAYYGPAQLRLGELYETRLHDLRKAKAAYRRLYEEHQTSPLRPTALWNEARVLRQQGAAACAPLRTLVESFPDSRYVPCAVDICREIVRPKASHAPAECHDYLREGGRVPGESEPSEGTDRTAP